MRKKILFGMIWASIFRPLRGLKLFGGLYITILHNISWSAWANLKNVHLGHPSATTMTQQCLNNVTTMSKMSQQCYKSVKTAQNHNNVTTTSQQCHNNVPTLSQMSQEGHKSVTNVTTMLQKCSTLLTFLNFFKMSRAQMILETIQAF